MARFLWNEAQTLRSHTGPAGDHSINLFTILIFLISDLIKPCFPNRTASEEASNIETKKSSTNNPSDFSFRDFGPPRIELELAVETAVVVFLSTKDQLQD